MPSGRRRPLGSAHAMECGDAAGRRRSGTRGGAVVARITLWRSAGGGDNGSAAPACVVDGLGGGAVAHFALGGAH